MVARRWGSVIPCWRVILLDHRNHQGYAGGHKGPHTTPRCPRPYGMMPALFV